VNRGEKNGRGKANKTWKKKGLPAFEEERRDQSQKAHREKVNMASIALERQQVRERRKNSVLKAKSGTGSRSPEVVGPW